MKNLLLTILLFTSFLSFSQKKELRNAKKLIDQSFYNEALDVLSTIDGAISSMDLKYQANYYYLLGWANKGDINYKEAIPNLKKSIDLDKLDKYKENAEILISQIETDLVNSAVEDNKSENYLDASVKLYDAYMIYPEQSESLNYLYFLNFY